MTVKRRFRVSGFGLVLESSPRGGKKKNTSLPPSLLPPREKKVKNQPETRNPKPLPPRDLSFFLYILITQI